MPLKIFLLSVLNPHLHTQTRRRKHYLIKRARKPTLIPDLISQIVIPHTEYIAHFERLFGQLIVPCLINFIIRRCQYISFEAISSHSLLAFLLIDPLLSPIINLRNL